MKPKYPIITKENFEFLTDKLVFKKRNKQKNLYYFIKVQTPKTRVDFFNLTERMFGVGLGIKTTYGGNYEIDGREDLYSKLSIPKLWNKKYGQYDGLRVFLDFVFNCLTCGGVATQHYGQFSPKGFRHKLRLEKFWKSQFVPSENIAKIS